MESHGNALPPVTATSATDGCESFSKAPMLEAEIADHTRIEQDLRRAEREHKRLLEAEQRARGEAEAAVRRLRTLQAISDAALAPQSIHDLPRELLVRISELLEVDNTALLIPTADGRHLVLHMAHGPEEQVAGQVSVPIGRGIAGAIAAMRRPLVVDDLRAAEVANPFLKQAIRSLMGVPLLMRGRLVGVLHAGTAAPRRFTEDDLQLLRLAGDRVALALEHVRLFEEEQRLLTERNRLQQVIDVLPEGIMIADANPPAVATMNRAAEELLGVNLVGMPVPIPPPGAEAEFAARRLDGTLYPLEDLPLERALLRGETVRADQFQIRHARSGREVMILANSAPLRDGQGTILGAVEVFQDISALKDLEREREQFLAAISHDLKNPLTSIMAVSQLLQLRSRSPAELDPARLERGLGVIGEAAQRMATQIDELLDAARARMGRPLRLEFAPTDVVALMAELVDEYQRTTEQHTLRLEQTVGTLVSMMDVARLRRPLANLLANAIKYSPRGGEIVTTLARGGDESAAWFAIRVTDQGVGIPPEEVDRVFDGFYRAGNVVGQFADSGLGLTGLRWIVEQHGGTTAIAGRPGSGTTVTVRLPLLHSPIEVGP